MNDDNKTAPILVTVKDAVRLLSLSRTRLYCLIGEGSLVAVKVGRRTLLTMASIRAYPASLPRADMRMKNL